MAIAGRIQAQSSAFAEGSLASGSARDVEQGRISRNAGNLKRQLLFAQDTVQEPEPPPPIPGSGGQKTQEELPVLAQQPDSLGKEQGASRPTPSRDEQTKNKLSQAQGPAIAPSQESAPPTLEEQMVALQKNVGTLQAQLSAAQASNQQDDKLKQQIELLQQQIETQQKMIQLLMEQVKKAPSPGGADQKTQTQVATLQSRSQQAAQRDVDLSQAVDNINEHMDAVERNGPRLPATLKELFLPSETNETPLSIYGALAFGYSQFVGDPTTAANGAGRPNTHGGFYFGEFTPDFLLKLNDWIFLEAEIGIGSDGSVSAGSFAQADFFVNDWLTIIAGRFVAPIGFYNERLNNPWVNKLPTDAPGSAPLLWLQVLPPMALLGV
ncbi:MAG: hypothetical protein DME61_11070, partial [Verrucomicrobia bacterium]